MHTANEPHDKQIRVNFDIYWVLSLIVHAKMINFVFTQNTQNDSIEHIKKMGKNLAYGVRHFGRQRS